MNRTHQLVFQFNAKTLEDFDELGALELAIEKGLPNDAKLDGHDSGLGEYNVFIHANDPVAMFEPIRALINHKRPGISFRAAYRNLK